MCLHPHAPSALLLLWQESKRAQLHHFDTQNSEGGKGKRAEPGSVTQRKSFGKGGEKAERDTERKKEGQWKHTLPSGWLSTHLPTCHHAWIVRNNNKSRSHLCAPPPLSKPPPPAPSPAQQRPSISQALLALMAGVAALTQLTFISFLSKWSWRKWSRVKEWCHGILACKLYCNFLPPLPGLDNRTKWWKNNKIYH